MKDSFLQFLRKNQDIVGCTLAAIIYALGLYLSFIERVSANEAHDIIQDERITQLTKKVSDYEVSLQSINEVVQRIDKNVVELNTKIDYKQDKLQER